MAESFPRILSSLNLFLLVIIRPVFIIHKEAA